MSDTYYRINIVGSNNKTQMKEVVDEGKDFGGYAKR